MLEYLAVRLVVASLEYTPRPVARFLARLYTALLDVGIPRLRRAALANLKLTGYPAEFTDRAFRSIADVAVAVAKFPSITRENVNEWIRYDGFEYFEEAKRRGKGVLFATAHLGNWELSAYAHALMAEPMSVVVRPLDNPRIDALVEKRRAMSGNTILGKRDFARSILKALARNEAVGILVDQNVGLNEGDFVQFFGMPACVSLTFAKLAARSGATVIPGFAVWNAKERRYVLKFYRPVEISGDALVDTQRIQSAVERAIREYPDQWLWVHRRWKTRPAGEKGLY